MIFRKTVLRLTLAYTAIQLVLFAFFAAGVYFFVTVTLDFDMVQFEGEQLVDPAEHAFGRLRVALVVVYAVLVVVVPVVSYFMARITLAPLRRSYEQQERFVDAASHEFRTPLGVVMGELELALMKPRKGAEYRRAIRTSLAAVDGMSTLASQLLILTRGDRRDLLSTFERVSLATLLERARETIEAGDTPQPRIDFKVSRSLEVVGSSALLRHAFSNVFDNAVKFTPPGGTIEVLAWERGGVTFVEVRDTGIGMTKDEVRHAFDRFWRAESARSSPGHGLGLALVHQIIGAHGGRVSIVSAPGDGTTVAISLPALTMLPPSST